MAVLWGFSTQNEMKLTGWHKSLCSSPQRARTLPAAPKARKHTVRCVQLEVRNAGVSVPSTSPCHLLTTTLLASHHSFGMPSSTANFSGIDKMFTTSFAFFAQLVASWAHVVRQVLGTTPAIPAAGDAALHWQGCARRSAAARPCPPNGTFQRKKKPERSAIEWSLKL